MAAALGPMVGWQGPMADARRAGWATMAAWKMEIRRRCPSQLQSVRTAQD